MNEILKKRIEEAAIEGSKHYDPNVSKYSQGKQVGYLRGFKNSIRHYEIGWLRKEKGYSKSKWAITNGFVEDDNITHWMPIPKFETKDKEDKQ